MNAHHSGIVKRDILNAKKAVNDEDFGKDTDDDERKFEEIKQVLKQDR